MSAGLPGSNDGAPPAGSAVLGLLLALGVIVAGVVLGYGLMLAIDAAFPEYTAHTFDKGLLADNNLEIALIVLSSPTVLLVLVGRRLQRKGRRRALNGYWIGALAGMTVLGMFVASLFYFFSFATFG